MVTTEMMVVRAKIVVSNQTRFMMLSWKPCDLLYAYKHWRKRITDRLLYVWQLLQGEWELRRCSERGSDDDEGVCMTYWWNYARNYERFYPCKPHDLCVANNTHTVQPNIRPYSKPAVHSSSPRVSLALRGRAERRLGKIGRVVIPRPQVGGAQLTVDPSSLSIRWQNKFPHTANAIE